MYLFRAGIHLTDSADILVWGHNRHTGEVTALLAYNLQVGLNCDVLVLGWTKKLFTGRMPLKLKCFTWLAFFDKILTWPNLQKWGFEGPGMCCLCSKEVETTAHLFGLCYFFLRIWLHLEKFFGFYFEWSNLDFNSDYLRWLSTHYKFDSLVSFVNGGVWKVRNRFLFDQLTPSIEVTTSCITASFSEHV